MNLVYSCVFVKKEYITLIDKLLTTFNKHPDNKNITYLIITSPDFEEDIKKVFEKLEITSDIFLIDISNKNEMDNIYESTYSRYRIFEYPKINNFNKILYLDCDILILNNINPIFSINTNNKFYFMNEKKQRQCHCALFSDEEFNKLNDYETFTTAVILFENNDIIRDFMIEIYNSIKNFHIKYKNPVPAFDQPLTNKYCINNNIYNNKDITKYCINIGHRDGPEILNKLKNYLLCHFSTNVGDYKSKLERINFTIDNLL